MLQLADEKNHPLPALCSASPVCIEPFICAVVEYLKPGHSGGVEPSFPQTGAQGGVEPMLLGCVPMEGNPPCPVQQVLVSAPSASCACIQAGTKPPRSYQQVTLEAAPSSSPGLPTL